MLIQYIYNIHIKAVSVVRKSRHMPSARMISRHFLSTGDFKSVVEFCLMAGMVDEAFELAKKHDVVAFYADLLGDEVANDKCMLFS